MICMEKMSSQTFVRQKKNIFQRKNGNEIKITFATFSHFMQKHQWKKKKELKSLKPHQLYYCTYLYLN